jgi:asparagine synthetase B (glutamine-hydrolysing)
VERCNRYKRDGFNLLLNLRGEFAFVLYDLKRRLMFAARDRFGIKPLYYTTFKGCIMFASEMKAFMGLGWQAEWDIDSIVHSGDFGGERTVFKDVQKVGIYFPALIDVIRMNPAASRILGHLSGNRTD